MNLVQELVYELAVRQKYICYSFLHQWDESQVAGQMSQQAARKSCEKLAYKKQHSLDYQSSPHQMSPSEWLHQGNESHLYYEESLVQELVLVRQ